MFLIPTPKKLLLLVIVVYALLPPVVVKQVGLENSLNNPVYDFVFYPLLKLADKFPPYRWILDQEAKIIGIDEPQWNNPFSRFQDKLDEKIKEYDQARP